MSGTGALCKSISSFQQGSWNSGTFRRSCLARNNIKWNGLKPAKPARSSLVKQLKLFWGVTSKNWSFHPAVHINVLDHMIPPMLPFTEINVTIIMTPCCDNTLAKCIASSGNKCDCPPWPLQIRQKGKLPACAPNQVDPYKGCVIPSLTQLTSVLGILVLFLQFLARHEHCEVWHSKPSRSLRKQRKQGSVKWPSRLRIATIRRAAP